MLQAAPLRVSWETFRPAGDATEARAFDVELRVLGRTEQQEMVRKCRKQVMKRVPNGQREWVEEADLPALRKYLAEHCIVSWKGLTVGKLLSLANKAAANGADPQAAVPCTPDNAAAVLEFALGFEDWVWETTNRLAEEREALEVREKNASAPTPEGSTST